MPDECVAEQGLRLDYAAGLADDAAQQAKGVGCSELVAEQALLCEALGSSLPAALVVPRHSVGQCQSGQRIALPEAVAEVLVLGQCLAEVPLCCRRVACADGGEPEIVVRQRDPFRYAGSVVDGKGFLEASLRRLVVPLPVG